MCGIYLLFDSQQINISQYLENLKKIQHRGHDSYGVIAKKINKRESDYPILKLFKKGKIFITEQNPNENYNLYLGHLRYKTSGLNSENGAQPIFSKNKFGQFTFVFNGNIPCDEYDTRQTLDTKMIKEFLEYDQHVDSWNQLLSNFVSHFKRAYSIIIITEDNKVYLLKDRFGVRPLCYGYSIEYNTLEVSSETVGISNTNNLNYQEVEAGQILVFDLENINKPTEVFNYTETNKIRIEYGGKCVFEYIYFLNPKTRWNKVLVSEIRNRWAESLAETDHQFNFSYNRTSYSNSEYLVIGIPSTGIEPGKAYADKLSLEYKQAITKNPNVNRTFILPDEERDKVSKKKYIYNNQLIQNKKVIIIDDSVVRGITMRNIVKSIFDCGALEVHIRIISPTITNICRYGIDIPTREELIAANNSITEMTHYFGATSLKFLEIESMLETINPYVNKNTICSGCFGGSYNEVDIEDLVVGQKNNEDKTCRIS